MPGIDNRALERFRDPRRLNGSIILESVRRPRRLALIKSCGEYKLQLSIRREMKYGRSFRIKRQYIHQPRNRSEAILLSGISLTDSAIVRQFHSPSNIREKKKKRNRTAPHYKPFNRVTLNPKKLSNRASRQ